MGASNKIKVKILVTAGIFLLLTGILTFLTVDAERKNSPQYIAQKFSEVLENKIQEANQGIKRLTQASETYSANEMNNLFGTEYMYLDKGRNIFYYIFEDDKMIFWTDRSIPIPSYYPYNFYTRSIINPGNGLYYPIVEKVGSRKYLALIKIKEEYSVSNSYLQNYFLPDFGVPKTAQVVTDDLATVYLSNKEGKALLPILYEREYTDATDFSITLLLFASVAAFFLFMHFLLRSITRRKSVLGVFLILAVVTGYVLFSGRLYGILPFSELVIFGPSLYAGSFFNSLGGFVLFSFWILFVFDGIKYIFNGLLKGFKISNRYLVSFAVLSFVMIFFLFFYKLVTDLILNSTVFPDTDNLTDFSFYSIWVALALLNCLLALKNGVGNWIEHFVSNDSKKLTRRFFLLLIPFLALGIWVNPAFLIFAPSILFSFVLFTPSSARNLFHNLLLGLSGGLLFVMGSVAAIDSKNDNEAAVLASKMVLENDPVTEYLYSVAYDNINKDEVFFTGIFSPSKITGEFTEQLIKKHFGGYWLKYNVSAGIFDGKTRSRLNLSNTGVYDYEYYQEIIDNSGLPTEIPGFFFVRKPTGRVSYIGKLDFVDSSKTGFPERTLFLEFNSRTITETAGLPDVLMDNSFLANQLMYGYSYARYTRGRLTNKSGDFPYFVEFDKWAELGDLKAKIKLGGHWHYIQKNSVNDYLVISREAQTLTDYLSRFSWWFLAFLLLLSIDYLLSSDKRFRHSLRDLGFKRKIQIVILITVSAFFVVMVSGSIYFLKRQHAMQNNDSVIEKVHAVTLNIEETMGGKMSRIRDQKGYLEYKLSELGNLFGTDINVYNTEGFLISGSRPELYTSGFLSERISPDAFRDLDNKKITEFVREENIGELKYISAYASLLDEDGKTAAYLNIPHFLKQKEISEELSGSINSLVNIFMAAITLLLSVVLLVTNRITDPLRELGERLRELRYGTKSQKIKYEGSDEIGDLVNEYNRLSDELEASAKLLAEKERDSAWREMARQVAHEIKNPLTPMKLNVEFLEKAWRDGADDFFERLVRFKTMMIEQIDTLSHIADEFSNFAKLPPPVNEKTNLNEVLKGVVALYEKNEQGVRISYKEPSFPMDVWADKEHLLRVFNNLIKNAIQAIPSHVQGQVEVFAFTDRATVTVLVKDNGTGIPEALRDRIFIPNFTTKSSGSGLGLAICRNIVREAGGNINFITEDGKGTTFRVMLPLYDKVEKSN